MPVQSKNVEDSWSQIKVTGLHAFRIGVKAYIKIETNMGVIGWGEINNMVTPVACALADNTYDLRY